MRTLTTLPLDNISEEISIHVHDVQAALNKIVF
jgi:hypothetical protein